MAAAFEDEQVGVGGLQGRTALLEDRGASSAAIIVSGTGHVRLPYRPATTTLMGLDAPVS